MSDVAKWLRAEARRWGAQEIADELNAQADVFDGIAEVTAEEMIGYIEDFVELKIRTTLLPMGKREAHIANLHLARTALTAALSAAGNMRPSKQ